MYFSPATDLHDQHLLIVGCERSLCLSRKIESIESLQRYFSENKIRSRCHAENRRTARARNRLMYCWQSGIMVANGEGSRGALISPPHVHVCFASALSVGRIRSLDTDWDITASADVLILACVGFGQGAIDASFGRDFGATEVNIYTCDISCCVV